MTPQAALQRVIEHREISTKVDVPYDKHFVDIVGTGGDSAPSFNISTTSIFVAAAAGAKIAKHGGRSVSSSSGRADVLEALGANINLPPEKVAACVEETGIGFMFAPNHHSAMKHVAPVRREMGVRTIFNILGPLTNPAGAPHTLLGVFHPDLVGICVRVMERRGAKAMLLGVLANKPGAAREIVALNAGTALYTANLVDSIGEGIARARDVLASGAARAKLEEFV